MKKLLITVVPLLLGACASNANNTVHTVQRSTERGNLRLESSTSLETRRVALNAAPTAAWDAVRGAYEDLGVPLAVYDTTQMEIGNPGLSVQRRLKNTPLSRYLNCGARPLGRAPADEYNVRLSVVSRVRPATEGSMLETTVSAEASQPGVSGAPVTCASTGALEQALFNAVQLRLAGQSRG